jgi:2-polyprenyl-3-methyl-5-hydroxy-6-metoxy-1,4-benzoquinol methylase
MSSGPSCPNCQRETVGAYRAEDLNRQVSRDAFPYYRCVGCDLIFLSPIPNDLGRFYPPDYYGFPTTLEPLARGAEAERYKIDIVKRFRSHGRLLELGPGGGGFVYLAKEAGFDVSAIEMSSDSCRFLTDIVGVRVVQSAEMAQAILAEEARYDVIAAWHVIEHLSDPWATIEAAVARLAPGGILVLAAPNPVALQFRILGRRWTHLDAPRHVLLIPIAVLESRAAALGLRTRMITTTDEGSRGWNRFGWIMSLRNVFPSRPTRVVRWVADALGGTLTSVLGPLEESGLNGSAYTVVFQKDAGS